MQWMMLPTLAWVDVVIVIGAILLTVGGWILNAIQKLNEKANQVRANREKAERQDRQDMHIGQVYDAENELQEITPSRSGETMTTQQRLDALAARRRAQMSQMRAQAGGNEAVASQPDNLTAAQKAARDRAREAYQRRAELLARQRQAQQQAAQAKQQAQQAKAARSAASRSSAAGSFRASSGGASRSATGATSGGASGAASGGGRAAAQAQAARQAQLAQQRARQQAQQQAAQAAAAREARQRAAGQKQPQSLNTAADAIQVERLEGRQTITNEGLDVVKTGAASSRSIDSAALKNALTGRSIRAAFVLKEVLDKPVGLRNAQDQAGVSSY